VPRQTDLAPIAARHRIPVLDPAGLVVVAVLGREPDVSHLHLVAFAKLRQDDLGRLQSVDDETRAGLERAADGFEKIQVTCISEQPEARAAAEGAVEFFPLGQVAPGTFRRSPLQPCWPRAAWPLARNPRSGR